MISKHAEAILRLPFVHHAAFMARVHELAADPKMTRDAAIDVLCREMDTRGVSVLDLEMSQPGTSYRVPFAVSPRGDPASDFQASVSGHVAQLLEQAR